MKVRERERDRERVSQRVRERERDETYPLNCKLQLPSLQELMNTEYKGSLLKKQPYMFGITPVLENDDENNDEDNGYHYYHTARYGHLQYYGCGETERQRQKVHNLYCIYVYTQVESSV